MTLTKNATHRALLAMLASAVMFGVMAYFAKLASNRLSGPEVALIRMVTGLAPVVFVARFRRAAMRFERADLLFLRGLFGGFSVMLYFMAIQHTTAGLATLLNYTAPIWSGVFSMIFIGERASARVLLPLSAALAGVFLVVHTARLGFGVWAVAGLLSGIASGAAVTTMRAARRGENSWSIYTSFCLLGALVNLPLALRGWKMPAGNEWLFLAATSGLAMGGQLLRTFSLRWVDAVTSGVMSQLAVVISMALGALFLAETITGLTAIGTALTLAGVIGVTYITSIGKQQPADEVGG